jgi:hypothetical protein
MTFGAGLLAGMERWLVHSQPDETIQEWEERGCPVEEKKPLSAMRHERVGAMWIDLLSNNLMYVDAHGYVREVHGRFVMERA